MLQVELKWSALGFFAVACALGFLIAYATFWLGLNVRQNPGGSILIGCILGSHAMKTYSRLYEKFVIVLACAGLGVVGWIIFLLVR